MDEAQRQQALIDAIGAVPPRGDPIGATLPPGLRESGPRAARGLEAYRVNAEAVAERALAAAFPTVRALLGADDFARAAREFWRDQPPRRGDLGEWGDGLGDWLQRHPGLAPWPYLGDCARLDFACHRNERAADAAFDAASLSLLESADPVALRLRLMPGVALLRSRWPIVAIHDAHRLEGDAAARAFMALADVVATPRAEDALVARDGWRAVVQALSPTDAHWTSLLLAGCTLDSALAQAGPGFDFADWLQRAIPQRWLAGVDDLSRAA